MASPRIFLSSTCYDLSEVRDSLVEFIHSYGFEPVLSDRGDVYYHPDVHTHESCLNEVANCNLLILIIGGRSGGNYIGDSSKTIVNAEYSAARKQNIPVFTFVKRSVYSDHFVYSKNKGNVNLSGIVFPSLEKNENAKSIFKFIDEVRQSDGNNGFFTFELASEITDLLRKQWAGMFFEFLQQRLATGQQRRTNNLLESISEAGDKVEELVKRLYRHVDASGADASIADIELQTNARSFYQNFLDSIPPQQLKLVSAIDASVDPKHFADWYDYCAAATRGTVDRTASELEVTIRWAKTAHMFRHAHCAEMVLWSAKQQVRFEHVKDMPLDARKAVISSLNAKGE